MAALCHASEAQAAPTTAARAAPPSVTTPAPPARAPCARKRPGLPSLSAALHAARRRRRPGPAPTICSLISVRARRRPRAARPTDVALRTRRSRRTALVDVPRASRRAGAPPAYPAPSLNPHDAEIRAPKLASVHLLVLLRLVKLFPAVAESATPASATVAGACCAPAAPTQALRGHAGEKPPGPPPRSAQHLARHDTWPRTRAHHRIIHTQPSRRRRPRRPRAT